MSVQRGPIHYVRTAEEVLHGLWIEGARHTQTTGSRSFSRYHLSLYVYPALLLRIEFHPSSKSRLNIPPRSRPFKAIDSNSIRQLDRRSFTIISNLVRIRASSRTRIILRLPHVCSPPRNAVLTIRFSLSISLLCRLLCRQSDLLAARLDNVGHDPQSHARRGRCASALPWAHYYRCGGCAVRRD